MARQKVKHPKDKKRFSHVLQTFFIISEGLSVVRNCLRRERGPLSRRVSLLSIENILRRFRLCWHDRAKHIDPDAWPRKVEKTILTGSNLRDHPLKTWSACAMNASKVKGLEASLTLNCMRLFTKPLMLTWA